MNHSEPSIERLFAVKQCQINGTIMAQGAVTHCESARPLYFNEDEY